MIYPIRMKHLLVGLVGQIRSMPLIAASTCSLANEDKDARPTVAMEMGYKCPAP